MDVLVGLDIGTTSAKAVAFDAEGAERGSAGVDYELHEPESGWAVQDPGEVTRGALEAARGAVEAARGQGHRVVAIACSSAMHSLIGLDREDRPLTPMITWADIRASEQAQRLRAEHPDLHGRTGTPLHPMSPLCKLVWLRENDPETFAAARRWVGIKELVVHELTGRWMLDHSCASGTGLFDIRERRYDPRAMELAGVDEDQLSALVPTTHVAETEDGIPLVVGAGDGPLANLGVGAVRPGVAAVSIGTSGALRVVVERPVTDPQGRVFCYELSEDRWVVGGAINNGGVVLDWVGDALAPDLGDDAHAQLLELAAQVPAGSEGLVMLPYLLSERAPHWSAIPRGAYVGLMRHHGRGHLIRAAVEGVCQQLAVVLSSVREAGNEIREVRATGGFARSELWRQMLTDALGTDVAFPHSREGSAYGAALLGAQALGVVGSIDVAADLVRIDEVRRPGPVAAVYERQQPVFSALYDALEPAFSALGESG